MQAARLDARDFLRAERAAQPQVDEGRSYPLLQQLLAQHPGKRPVVTGFISRNDAGETVLLGRNGSDYSATQVGALAGAARVTIWSDVAGVYSADPRKVKDACLLPLLRSDEASELARGGAGAAYPHPAAGLRQRYRSSAALQLPAGAGLDAHRARIGVRHRRQDCHQPR